MPKKSIIAREKKRQKLVKQFEGQRKELKQIIKSSNDFTLVSESQKKLAKLPLNSNPVRYSTRCQQCGRTHAVYRQFNLCRICLRQQLMIGNVPGGRKSSW